MTTHLLLRRTAVLLLGALALGACHGGSPRDPLGDFATDENKIAEIVLESPPRETARPALLQRTPPSMLSVITRIDAIRKDSHVKGIFLRVGSLGGAWGRIADLEAAFAEFKKTKKPIHCYFEATDNAGYSLAASVCDRISMTPSGWLDLVGVAAQVFFARSLLERLGLQADFVKMGKYKSAIEPMTSDSMSPENREALDALLDDIDHELVARIGKGRKIEESKVHALIDEGPFDADRAQELGLIDDVAFDDEAREHLRRATKTKIVRRLPLREEDEEMTLGRILEALSGKGDEQEASGERLALVYVVGNIVDSEESEDGNAPSGPFVKHLRKLGDDKDVKAVLIRIDSPGGSALASDRMWHAVQRVAKRKPVIVSVGDMAASGGYYIASAGRELYAQPNSIVGSIGVFGGKIAAQELTKKIGVNVETLRRGKNAAWMSAMQTFSDTERAILERMLRQTYDRFLDRVSTGRGIPREKVDSLAQGRVWSAQRVQETGLVTKLGSFGDALARARTLGKLGADAPIDAWPRTPGMLDALAGKHDDEEAMIRAVVGRETMERLRPVAEASLLRLLGHPGDVVFAALPFALDIR